jgi:hypothetical protein
MPGTSKRCCRRARAHDAGVPQPLIYALAVQTTSAPFPKFAIHLSAL